MTLKAEKRARRAAEEAKAQGKPPLPRGVRCFMLDPLDPELTRWWLRRYGKAGNACPGRMSYHNALTLIGDATQEPSAPPHENSGWPTHCGCGYAFQPEDAWQVFGHPLYRRRDTGEIVTIEEAPPGAMWDARWLADIPAWRGPDGRSLVVKLPNGREWCIDGRASNCTMPKDDVHKCWVRSGEPPDLTVGKSGNTCAAGAGSIQAGDYHGFLRNGRFEP